jgi:hypothetical protein
MPLQLLEWHCAFHLLGYFQKYYDPGATSRVKLRLWLRLPGIHTNILRLPQQKSARWSGSYVGRKQGG